MTTVGIDIGGPSHAVARCRDGLTKADREVLRVSQSRAGFGALDAWLERQAEPVTLVTMQSSGHYWMPLASHRAEGPHADGGALVNNVSGNHISFAALPEPRDQIDPVSAAWTGEARSGGPRGYFSTLEKQTTGSGAGASQRYIPLYSGSTLPYAD